MCAGALDPTVHRLRLRSSAAGFIFAAVVSTPSPPRHPSPPAPPRLSTSAAAALRQRRRSGPRPDRARGPLHSTSSSPRAIFSGRLCAKYRSRTTPLINYVFIYTRPEKYIYIYTKNITYIYIKIYTKNNTTNQNIYVYMVF